MRNLIKSLALIAAVVAVGVPATASAVIANSKHDLASGSTATVRSSTTGGTDQTCIFCHTPHKATVATLIWNRRLPTTVAGWTATSSFAGTTLPANVTLSSQRCMSCHDGSIALGEVANSAGTGTTFTMVNAGVGGIITTANLIGANLGANNASNHPVSIPYPAGARGTIIYNGVTGQADPAGFAAAQQVAACTSASGICTVGATGGVNINLYGTLAAPGVECGSCHEVHNKYPNAYFLRAPATGSQICRACHIK